MKKKIIMAGTMITIMSLFVGCNDSSYNRVIPVSQPVKKEEDKKKTVKPVILPKIKKPKTNTSVTKPKPTPKPKVNTNKITRPKTSSRPRMRAR